MDEVANRRKSDHRNECRRERTRYGHLYGRSPAMQALYRSIGRVAPTDTTVFLQGESGTGKELIAQTIHDKSARHESTFVPVNCGALSASLIESELFGHERGSFTGATRRHRGCFEQANGGTLFLDEIAEMQLDLQVRLLRVLENRKLTRVGGQTQIDVDVRVIAATNCCVAQAIASGRLREDLYFRLATFPINVPPLRERSGDVDLLVQHFLASLNSADGITKVIAPAALEELRRYSWPGNVRELKNLLQRAYILADDMIDIQHLPSLSDEPDPVPGNGVLNVAIGTRLEEVERRLIFATLAHFGGNKKRTADTLGISLKTIYNRLQYYERRDRQARAVSPEN